MKNPTEDLTGRQLGPYQLVAPLGKGGMGVVYKAYDTQLARYVAVKVLPPRYVMEPTFVSRFWQEAKAAANLEHPHILPVHRGEHEGYHYIAMQLCARVAGRVAARPARRPALPQGGYADCGADAGDHHPGRRALDLPTRARWSTATSSRTIS
jgi:hypothetical protein